jgi:hypothetical protein
MGEEMPQLAERMLEHLDLSLTSICLTLGGPISADLDRLLEDLEILLGSSVEVFALEDLSQSEVQDALELAGLILLAGGSGEGWIDRLQRTPYADQPDLFLSEGKVLMAIGIPSSAIGSWAITDPTTPPLKGLNWLKGAIVLPAIDNPMASPVVRDLLAEQNQSYALGLPKGSMIAFGPQGEVEMWGGAAPVIALGLGWGDA